MNNKNILILIENGIIALDIRKVLSGYGYNTEVVHPAGKEKIEAALKKGFQLLIIEKQIDHKGIMEAVKLAEKYNLPTIYLSTDEETADAGKSGLRILMMPFGEDDLKEVVRMTLGD